NGAYAGVRIRERLSRAVDVEVAERDDWNLVGAPEKQGHFFLIFFGERIDRGALQRLVLTRGNRHEALAARGAERLPVLGLELLQRARLGSHFAALTAEILPFSVDRHR